MGQFTSADSVQGPNRYGYVLGNPETMTDPTGHDAWWGGSDQGGWCATCGTTTGGTKNGDTTSPYDAQGRCNTVSQCESDWQNAFESWHKKGNADQGKAIFGMVGADMLFAISGFLTGNIADAISVALDAISLVVYGMDLISDALPDGIIKNAIQNFYINSALYMGVFHAIQAVMDFSWLIQVVVANAMYIVTGPLKYILGLIIGFVGQIVDSASQAGLYHGRQEFAVGDVIEKEGLVGWCNATGNCDPTYQQRFV